MGLRKRTPDERIENALRRAREHLAKLSDMLIAMQTIQPFCRSRSERAVEFVEDIEQKLGVIEDSADTTLRIMGKK